MSTETAKELIRHAIADLEQALLELDMGTDAAKELIRHAITDLEQALLELDSTPPQPPSQTVTTPEEFDSALAAATDGSTIVCATTLQYTAPLTIGQSRITIRSEHEGSGRMTSDEPAPWFQGQVVLNGSGIILKGLQLTNSKLTDVLVLKGASPTIDRCRILGDHTQGSKRGIAANASNVTIVRCYIDFMFGPYPGDDTQAICAWDSPGPFSIEDNYLSGASESVMFGGADPSSEANLPSDIVIRGNTITKRAEWQTQAVGVKNTFELKNARRVLIENNDFSYSWGGHGQDGYLLMLTPRNQSGTAPYSTVEDVEIRNNRFASGAGAISMLGADNNHPSQRLARINIHHNRFEDVDSQKYTGSNKMILVAAGPTTTTIDANEFQGANVGSVIYFDGSPLCQDLVVTNNKWPHSKYGVFGSNASTGTGSNGLPNAWNQYVASGTFSGNVEW